MKRVKRVEEEREERGGKTKGAALPWHVRPIPDDTVFIGSTMLLGSLSVYA